MMYFVFNNDIKYKINKDTSCINYFWLQVLGKTVVYDIQHPERSVLMMLVIE